MNETRTETSPPGVTPASGVASTQVAEWAGHSVAALHQIYARCPTDGEAHGRGRIALTGNSHFKGAVVPPERWNDVLPDVLANMTRKIIPPRRDRTCPRAVKRARHNNYRVKRPETAAPATQAPPAINLRTLTLRAT